MQSYGVPHPYGGRGRGRPPQATYSLPTPQFSTGMPPTHGVGGFPMAAPMFPPPPPGMPAVPPLLNASVISPEQMYHQQLVAPTMGHYSSSSMVDQSIDRDDLLEGSDPNLSSSSKKNLHLRRAGGNVWSDSTLDDWPNDDYRVFCGDLGNEVTDELLTNAFRHFKSFQRARVIRDRRTGKGKGYGFVSFSNPEDMLKAMKEMDRKYVGNRPIRVMKSRWRERDIDSERSKRVEDLGKTTSLQSKTLRKFKILKPVTGGKKSKAIPPALAASGTRRGFHGPRPPPFTQLPRVARTAE